MDRERWRRLQDLFSAIRASPGMERERLLREASARDPALAEEVRALLAADESTGVMDSLSPYLGSIAGLLDVAGPAHIGSYRIVSEIGRGGMGTVYLAERAGADFDQRVAIKLIESRDTADPLHQRFLAERRILAALVHPHIARLVDGGLTDDGRPYLVMDYVDGLPITAYCDAEQLDLPARLHLFADVCEAVQHAHQSLVIHRDLKPSNILVSADGHVHLLDFGIAKLLDPEVLTAPQTRLDSSAGSMMTPEYASPEQVRGETLATTSDIYALGVLLYELVCGRAPYRFETRSPLAIAAVVCEQDPERPSTRLGHAGGAADVDADTVARRRGTSVDRLTRMLDGDLDAIVLMAMRKEPGRRYASADMLRQDVERHLAGQPVIAHRGGRRYRVRKFIRRHRIEAAAVAMVIAALVAGLSVAVSQGRRAARERDRAEQALAESTGVTAFLLELFEAGDGSEPPATELTALDLLRRGALQADQLAGQPIVHARLLDVIGQMSYHLGRLNEARGRLEQAVAIRRSTPGVAPTDLAASLIHLAWVHRLRNDHARAQSLVGEALELRRGALPPGHPDVADALYEMGWLSTGVEQERLYRQAADILAGVPGAAERRVVVLQALSTNLRRQGRLAEAVTAGREALAAAEAAFGSEHHTAGAAMIHLADHVADVEQDAAASERLYREGLSRLTRQFGDRSIRLLHGLNSLGRLLSRQGRPEAEAQFRRALEISQAATGPEHPRVADQMHKLAGALARQRRLEEAEALARQAMELTIKTVGPTHQLVAASRLPLLAQILDQQGRYAEADRTYAMAFEQLRTSGVIAGEAHRDYAAMLLGRGDTGGAEVQLLRSLARLEEAYGGQTHPNVHETRRALMALYRRLGKPEAVERYRVPDGRFIPY